MSETVFIPCPACGMTPSRAESLGLLPAILDPLSQYVTCHCHDRPFHREDPPRLSLNRLLRESRAEDKRRGKPGRGSSSGPKRTKPQKRGPVGLARSDQEWIGYPTADKYYQETQDPKNQRLNVAIPIGLDCIVRDRMRLGHEESLSACLRKALLEHISSGSGPIAVNLGCSVRRNVTLDKWSMATLRAATGVLKCRRAQALAGSLAWYLRSVNALEPL